MKKFLLVILLMLSSTAVEEMYAVRYEPFPNRPEFRGFSYCLDMADYPHLLLSNMPYRVMQGYIVADSIVRYMPSITYFWNPIDSLNLQSDTVQYIYKYWYLMNEYDPIQFYSFLNTNRYRKAKHFPNILHSDLRRRMYIDQKFTYVVPSYILHVYVNNTVWVDTTDTNRPDDFSETTAYCKILDTLKGGCFPSLDNAIFYNGPLLNNTNEIVGNTYSIPQETDIVFSYIDQWRKWQGGGWLFDSKGDHWIKPNREYIVFLEFQGLDAIGEWDSEGNIHKEYYALMPYPHTKSYSMYPIENGNVIDEKNALGFGTSVHVDVFKQNIRKIINAIKNYGE